MTELLVLGQDCEWSGRVIITLVSCNNTYQDNTRMMDHKSAECCNTGYVLSVRAWSRHTCHDMVNVMKLWKLSLRSGNLSSLSVYCDCEICINEDLIGFSMSFKVHYMRSSHYLPLVWIGCRVANHTYNRRLFGLKWITQSKMLVV